MTPNGSRQPNFLFLFPDQQRPDWLGFNESLDIETPVLESLAGRGVRFTNAITPSPLCAPARACLASGRSYDRCRVPNNLYDYPLDLPTYYQSLRDAGYRVGGVGKFDLHKRLVEPEKLDWHLDGSRLLSEWGFTEGVDNEGKFDGSNSYRSSGRPKGPYLKLLADHGLADVYVGEHDRQKEVLGAYTTELPDELYCDNWVAENGKGLIADFPKDQPWHLVVNFTGPHNPMDVTQRMRDTVEKRDFDQPVANTQHTPEDLLRNRQNYAAMIENIDRLCGELIAEVESRGELENTVIIYSSDHGEMLGDFNRFGKNTWRFGSAHIPLVMAGPGIESGRISDSLVDLTDVTATILDLAGCPGLPDMDGMTLRPNLDGSKTGHRTVVTSGLDEWRMAYDGRFKVVTGASPTPMLYDLSSDPHEQRDISADSPGELARLLAEVPGQGSTGQDRP